MKYRIVLAGLLAGLVIGCASAPSSKGRVSVEKQVKGSLSGSQTGLTMTGDIQSNYRRGLSYLEQGRLDKAQSTFEALTIAQSGWIELHNALGVVYRKRGIMDKAIREYKMAITLGEKSSTEGSRPVASGGLYNNLAIAYREDGKFKEAEEAYQRAISTDANFAAAHYNLGVLYDLYLNRLPEAVRHYREYERLAGKDDMVDIWIEDLEQRILRGEGNGIGLP